jgi:phenylacetate-CoA ligase
MVGKSHARYSYKPNYIHTDLLNGYYIEWKEFLSRSENWSQKQIEEYQLSEIKRVVRHAYENTRAYHKLYDKIGITPDSFKTMEDFQKLPFVSKEMIRDNLEDFQRTSKGGNT